MDIRLEWHEGILIAFMDGDLDLENRDRISVEFKGNLDQRPKGVLLNFTRARYVSSLGIGMIVQLYKELKEVGAALRIAGVQPPVRLVLETCSLGKLVPMDETIDFSLRQLRGHVVKPPAGNTAQV